MFAPRRLAGMAAVVTVAAGGSAGLAKLTVFPCPRENCSVRGTWVQGLNNFTDKLMVVSTGFRLGERHLLSIHGTGSRTWRAAARDNAGVWSEWSEVVNLNLGAYAPGATECSIGSAATTNAGVQDAGVVFPDLAQGSGRVKAFRTLVAGKAYLDEQRQPAWHRARSVFNCVFDALSAAEAKLIHRFYRTVNGPRGVFHFDWYPPERGTRTTAAGAERYLVRFRDALPEEIFDNHVSQVRFALVEAMDEPEGGDV